MSQSTDKPPAKRQYPPLYEKIVPVAIGLIGIGVILMVIVATGVALGFFP